MRREDLMENIELKIQSCAHERNIKKFLHKLGTKPWSQTCSITFRLTSFYVHLFINADEFPINRVSLLNFKWRKLFFFSFQGKKKIPVNIAIMGER